MNSRVRQVDEDVLIRFMFDNVRDCNFFTWGGERRTLCALSTWRKGRAKTGGHRGKGGATWGEDKEQGKRSMLFGGETGTCQ